MGKSTKLRLCVTIMEIINKYSNNRTLYFILLASVLLFGCKTKYEKITHIDSEAELYLNGRYLKKGQYKNGYYLQHFNKKYVVYGWYPDEKPMPWGYRIGKYKHGKQKGKWFTYTYWSNERVLNKPQIHRIEKFKNGLQHGPYTIYNSKGRIIYYTKFKNGTGVEKDYHPNGVLYYKIEKEKGYFTDTLKLYDDSGRLTEFFRYEKDSLVFSKNLEPPKMRHPKREIYFQEFK